MTEVQKAFSESFFLKNISNSKQASEFSAMLFLKM